MDGHDRICIMAAIILAGRMQLEDFPKECQLGRGHYILKDVVKTAFELHTEINRISIEREGPEGEKGTWAP